MFNNESQTSSSEARRSGFGIKSKLIAVLAAAVLATLLAQQLLVGGAAGNPPDSAGKTSQRIAETTSALVAQRLRENLALLETLALTDDVRNQARGGGQAATAAKPDGSATGGDAMLRKFQKRFPQHIELVLTNKSGAIVASTAGPRPRTDETWHQQAYQNGAGEIHIGKPAVNPTNGGTTIPLAIPVRENGTNVLGVLYTALDTQVIVDALAAGGAGEPGRSFLVNAEGAVLFDQTKGVNPDQKLLPALLGTGLLKKNGPGWLEAAAFDDEEAFWAMPNPRRQPAP
jgi:hypothetical protein